MIGKTVKGHNFRGVLNYVLDKPGAKYITSHNMLSTSADELAKEFQAITRQNKRVKIPVSHTSLSPHPSEKIDNKTVIRLAQEYMKRMGFESCQWVMALHNDTSTEDGLARPHYHIIANRVQISNNKTVSAWMDWRRSETILRELESEFKLTKVQPSWEILNRAPTTGEERKYRRQKKEYEKGNRESPPEKSTRFQIQSLINETIKPETELSQFLKDLQTRGVETRCKVDEQQKIIGISYRYQGKNFSGTQLGRAYTFPGLQKHYQLKYSKPSDNQLIKGLEHQSSEGRRQEAEGRRVQYDRGFNPHELPNTKSEILLGDLNPSDRKSPEVREQNIRAFCPRTSAFLTKVEKDTHFVATTLARYLNEVKSHEIEGQKYEGRWEHNELRLFDLTQNQEILRVHWQNEKWTIITSKISADTKKDFERLQKQLNNREKEPALEPLKKIDDILS